MSLAQKLRMELSIRGSSNFGGFLEGAVKGGGELTKISLSNKIFFFVIHSTLKKMKHFSPRIFFFQ